MKARLIATVEGFTTLKNSTTTVNHIIEVEGSIYMVEASCLEKIEYLKPIKIEKLEPKDVTLNFSLE